jgi:DNA ligase-1
LDAEFEIVGCDEGSGKDEGKAIFVCKIKNGKTFSVRCKGADEVRQEQWKNRKAYIGKELTVRYQTLSDDGIPIFPVGIIVRDYE